MDDGLPLNANAETTIHMIRAIAAQSVVVGHAASFFKVLHWMQPPNSFFIQNFGVVIFFFLSGFIINYTCQVKNHTSVYSYIHFLFDRSFRLLIVYVPALVLVSVLDHIFINMINPPFEYQDSLTFANFLGNTFFLQEYPVIVCDPGLTFKSLPIALYGTGRPFWTLSVEFWLYVFFGFLILSKPKRNLLKIACTALFLLSLPVVVFNSFGGKGNCLACVWFLGALSLAILRYSLESKYLILYILSLPVLMILIWHYSSNDFTKYDVVANLLIGVFLLIVIKICLSVQRNLYSNEFRKMIMFLANYSFSLYAIHYPILFWMNTLLSKYFHKSILFLLGIIVSNGIAIFFAIIFEFNYKNYRDIFKRYFLRNHSYLAVEKP